MGQGGYPTADQVARGWLKAADLADMGDLWRWAARRSQRLNAALRYYDLQWVLFAALRTAFPGLTWEEVCRMTGLDSAIADMGDLGQAVRSIPDFWPRVQAVFGVIVGPGR